jgi:hypothetical protein
MEGPYRLLRGRNGEMQNQVASISALSQPGWRKKKPAAQANDRVVEPTGTERVIQFTSFPLTYII